MTLHQLHQLLGQLIEQGTAKRLSVCIDKDTFQDVREVGGCVILEVCAVEVQSHVVCDGDGFTAVRADGSERQRTSVVLMGPHREPAPARRAP